MVKRSRSYSFEPGEDSLPVPIDKIPLGKCVEGTMEAVMNVDEDDEPMKMTLKTTGCRHTKDRVTISTEAIADGDKMGIMKQTIVTRPIRKTDTP